MAASEHWVSQPNEAIKLKIEAEGPASEAPLTVMQVFEQRVAEHPNKIAVQILEGEEYRGVSWQDYYNQVLAAAKSMIVLGLERYKGVAILGFNSIEWFVADLAAIAAGGLAAGIYTTNGADACHYIIEHCEANLVFVEDEKHLKKILEVRSRLPKLKAIVQWSGTKPDGVPQLYNWQEFLALGANEPDTELRARIADLKVNECCTLIYTSGTTGAPKAVMISHDNITWTSRQACKMIESTGDDHMVSYLPLSHIAAQLLDVHGPHATGHTIWFAKPDALKGSLGTTLKVVRPTIFLGVPRVWEKMQEKMRAVGANAGFVQASVAAFAKDIGLRGNYADQRGEQKPWGWWLASTLVFSKVRLALGLDRCRLCVTSAAPISRETLEYFLALDIPIYEVFGMSECTGPQTVSLPGFGRYKTGSCGKAMPGSQLVVDKADREGNGELIFKGRHVFMGYMKQAEATAQTIDAEGWLHSGDVGKVDEMGFIYITGRIKELLITAGGENVPPVLIENLIKEALPVVSNVVVIGDRRKYLAALVSLRCEVNPDTGAPTDELTAMARRVLEPLGFTGTTVSAAIADERVKAHVEAGITHYNNTGSTSNAQKIRRWAFLPTDFSIAGDELTATMKLKRRVVNDKYAELIETLYPQGDD